MPQKKTCLKCETEFEGRRASRYCSVECYFWSRLDNSGGPDACWPWTGSINKQNGYGCVDAYAGGGKRTTAHRRAYRLFYGVDPGRLNVLHSCDTRKCGNPRHLFLGTHRDNWMDAVGKGRCVVVRFGEGNASAKLTEAAVRKIRQSPDRTSVLAGRYGVHRETIVRIRSGQYWRHVQESSGPTGSDQINSVGTSRGIAGTRLAARPS